MQDCPLFFVRALTAVSIAVSISALGITIKGSFPPSSSTHFFIARPAVAATALPARSLPVRVTASTRSILDDLRDFVGLDQQRSGKRPPPSRSPEEILNRQGALRHVRRVFEQADVAGHQSRRGKAKDLPERENSTA